MTENTMVEKEGGFVSHFICIDRRAATSWRGVSGFEGLDTYADVS